METNLGMDGIQETPVEGMIARWKRIVEKEERMSAPFSMFYLAGPDNKQAEAISYLSELLGIAKDDQLTVQAEVRSRDLYSVY